MVSTCVSATTKHTLLQDRQPSRRGWTRRLPNWKRQPKEFMKKKETVRCMKKLKAGEDADGEDRRVEEVAMLEEQKKMEEKKRQCCMRKKKGGGGMT